MLNFSPDSRLYMVNADSPSAKGLTGMMGEETCTPIARDSIGWSIPGHTGATPTTLEPATNEQVVVFPVAWGVAGITLTLLPGILKDFLRQNGWHRDLEPLTAVPGLHRCAP